LNENFENHKAQTQQKVLMGMIGDAARTHPSMTVSELQAQILAKPSLSHAFLDAVKSSNNQSNSNENRNQSENQDRQGLENENDSNQEMDVEN
jgi:hypothetical protein